VQDRRINPRVGIKPIADLGAGENLAREFINCPGAAPMQMLGMTPDGGIEGRMSSLEDFVAPQHCFEAVCCFVGSDCAKLRHLGSPF
jgi:hypothetical protein